MSKKKSKPAPQEPLSDETKGYLGKLEQRAGKQQQVAETATLFNAAIMTVSNCQYFFTRSGTWQYHEGALANIEWMRGLDWNTFASRWVREGMPGIFPLVERAAAAVEVPADYFFEYDPPAAPPSTGVDPAGYMAGIVARLRGKPSDKEIEKLARELGLVLTNDPLSVDAYGLYFAGIAHKLVEVGQRFERGIEPLVPPRAEPASEVSPTGPSPDDLLASIEVLYDITRHFTVTVPGTPPKEIDRQQLAQYVDGARHDVPKLLGELSAAAEERGISATPLADFGTRWMRLCREHGGDRIEVARQFPKYLDEQFVVETFQATTHRLKVKLLLEQRAIEARSAAATGRRIADTSAAGYGSKRPHQRPTGSSKAGDRPKPQADQAFHGDEFTWVSWFGRNFDFKKGNQAAVVKVLWEAWKAGGKVDGRGLTQEAIGERIGSSSDRFRVDDTFRGHPAFGSMIQKTAAGTYALFRTSSNL